MPRSTRLERPGGLFHVISRANNKESIFTAKGASASFEKALFEAVEKHEWIAHGFTIMDNHFHLALETPKPNLSKGMHWLLTTYAVRHNLHWGRVGHVFQGRYKSIPIEDSIALSRVLSYIHLNPVRAGILPAEQVANFRWSSLRHFLNSPDGLPNGLQSAELLAAHGLPNTKEGWLQYLRYLQVLASDKEEQKRLEFDKMVTSFAIGTPTYRLQIAKEYRNKSLAGLKQEAAREICELHWAEVLEEELAKIEKTEEDLVPIPAYHRGESWRWQIAYRLREIGTPYRWIADKLGYASANSLRVRYHQHRKKLGLTNSNPPRSKPPKRKQPGFFAPLKEDRDPSLPDDFYDDRPILVDPHERIYLPPLEKNDSIENDAKAEKNSLPKAESNTSSTKQTEEIIPPQQPNYSYPSQASISPLKRLFHFFKNFPSSAKTEPIFALHPT